MGMGTQSIVAAISDLAGNTTFATSTVTLGGVTNSIFWTDAAGNYTSVRYRSTSFAARRLYYDRDIRHRLTQVRVGASEIIESYGYDALNRRIWTASGSVTNWHVYDGAHVIADVDAAGNPVRSYTWGPGIDNLLAMTVHTGATDRTYYALTDRLGTVHALADETGEIAESYRYDAWGRVLGVYSADGAPMEQSALGNRYLFQGREYSWAVHIGSWTGAGIYYFRNRWYDPVIGRWLSNDPIGIAGGLNQYVAFGNNPVNYLDPLGLWSWDAGMFFRGLGGAVVSGAGAVVGAAAATTGVGSVPGGALALYSSYQVGANIGNMVNSFRGVEAAPTGPIATATVLATDNRTARNIAEAADLAIPLALSIGTSPVAWSRLPTAPVGPAGTLAGTLQRVPGDPAVIYPWIRGFQIGHAGLTAHDAWQWAWDNDSNKSNPCK